MNSAFKNEKLNLKRYMEYTIRVAISDHFLCNEINEFLYLLKNVDKCFFHPLKK